MGDYLFPPQIPSVAIVGRSQRFPVHRIYCVGRNYAEHAREMGSNPERESPFFFCKPADAIAVERTTLTYPTRTADLHHEVELVVAIQKQGSNISVAQAHSFVVGYAVGIDLTRRDLQAEAKQKGRPWDTAKGFDYSAPISPITPLANCGELNQGNIQLAVNGEIKQRGDISDLIWSVPEILVELSTLFTLQPGDLIFTGTPAGVGPVQKGDKLLASVNGLPDLQITIAG